MEVLALADRREVCWDEYLMESADGIRVEMHHPEYRGVALTCDKGWEGSSSGYGIILKDGSVYRMYYRGANGLLDCDGNLSGHPNYFCLAETRDGKTFVRTPVNREPFLGIRETNILLGASGDNNMDNFAVFYDTNPACPPGERYKGLSGDEKRRLVLFTSADGIEFERRRILVDDGNYDSVNICFWDADAQEYRLYYRGLHGPKTDGSRWTQDGDWETHFHNKGVVRDIRVRTSKDFVNWDAPRHLDYGPDAPDDEMYTNNVMKYPRAPHVLLAMPTRYVDRYLDRQNFPHLPDWEHRQAAMRYLTSRMGTAMTDTVLMTSRDGVHFRRTEEAWMTPGYERDANWYYGDCYFTLGMIETASEIPGAPNELSVYVGVNAGVKDIQLLRYAVRLDGFFSWRCDAKPGKVVTKPFTFSGDRLTINFATSARGYVRIRLLDAEGNPLEGFDSGRLFGNSISRPVDFAGDLSALAGKPVRMEITMSDADLYAFRFAPWGRFWDDME